MTRRGAILRRRRRRRRRSGHTGRGVGWSQHHADRQAGAGEDEGCVQGVPAAAERERRAAADLFGGAGDGRGHLDGRGSVRGGAHEPGDHVLAGAGEAARERAHDGHAGGTHRRAGEDGDLGQRVGEPDGVIEIG